MRSSAAESAPIRLVGRRASLPGVSMVHLTLEHGLSRAVPHRHTSVLHLEGEAVWSVRRSHWTTRPGTLGVKVPGEVYAERSRQGRSRFQLLIFDDALIDEARATLDRPPSEPRARTFDGLRDPRVRPLMALHQAFLDEEATDAALQQTLSEALETMLSLTAEASPRPAIGTAAVLRARALLDERIAEAVTLDELATYARLDKFRLCRAFREYLGLPPHAYVTHRRVSLAQELLARGMPQAEVAVQVGLYDQSQLHRHFKRILGVTPGAWARAMGAG